MSDTLTEGQKLVRGESLVSNNGAYTLTLQDDGNLVLASRGKPLWSTSTNGQDVVRAEVQPDGNFVLYTADKPVWHSDTKGKKDVRLVLQDDRNLVLYAADGPAWSTKTETDPRRRHRRPRPLRSRAAVRPKKKRSRSRRRSPSRKPPEPAPEPAARTYTVESGDTPVGHRGALLRRRQQVPGDRRCQRHPQPRPDPPGPSADDSLIVRDGGCRSNRRLTCGFGRLHAAAGRFLELTGDRQPAPCRRPAQVVGSGRDGGRDLPEVAGCRLLRRGPGQHQTRRIRSCCRRRT